MSEAVSTQWEREKSIALATNRILIRRSSSVSSSHYTEKAVMPILSHELFMSYRGL
jgi:hypothetical protein